MRIGDLTILAGAVLTALLVFSCGGPPLPQDPVVLFSRNPLEPIYAEDVPAPEEIGRPVVLRAARGEYESASVGLFSREGLEGASLSVSDLEGPGEAVIPTSAASVKITRYMEPMRRWTRPKRHPLLPGFLDAKSAVDLAPRTSQQFWLTLHVPDDAPAGEYRGSVRLTGALTVQVPSGVPAAGRQQGKAQPAETPPRTAPELELRLTVWPFRLPEARPSYFLYGNNFPLSEENFAEARRHGMNTICVNHGWAKNVVPEYEDGAFEYPDRFERLTEVIETARRYGLGVDHPIGVMLHSHLTLSIPVALEQAGVLAPDDAAQPGLEDPTAYTLLQPLGAPLSDVPRQKGPYYPSPDPYAPPSTPFGKALYRGWVSSMRTLDSLATDKHWPGLWYYLIDEPHHSRGAMRLAIELARAADEAGANGMITCNEPTMSEPDEDKLWFGPVDGEPALRLEPWVGTRCYHNKYLGPETLERTREAGDVYGTYVNIYGNQPASTRYLTGYLAWRLNLDLVMLWQWKNVSTDFEGSRSYLRDWEAAREGIDDLKYLQLLETLVGEGREPGPALERARSLLEQARESIVPDVRKIGYVDGVSGEWVPGSAAWSPDRFDELRRQVAEAIVALDGSR